MREAFANSQHQKAKLQKPSANNQQISQRSGQSHHQKTNSMTAKTAQLYQQQINMYGDLPGKTLSNPSASSGQPTPMPSFKPLKHKAAHLQQPHANQGKASQPVAGSLNLHKKSNSLMNSKMAQLLIKGGPNATAQGAPHQKQPNIFKHQINYQPQNPGIGGMAMGALQQPHIPNYKIQNYQHNLSNITSSQIAKLPNSSNTSFVNNPKDPMSYSIDQHRHPQDGDDYEDNMSENLQISSDQQQFHQVPSNKVLGKHAQAYKDDSHFPEPESQKKKCSSKGSNQKVLQQKVTKKVMGSHQRTKSDNFCNRGSTANANITKSIGQAHQNKRQGALMKNNFVDINIDQFIQKPTHQKNPSAGQSMFSDGSQSQNPRKTPNSAHHSKKPSDSHNTYQHTPASQQKRSTKEKYNELKALYSDLLERHQVLSSTQQNQSNSYQLQQQMNRLQQAPAQNPINFYPPQSNYLQQQDNLQTNPATTPRILNANQQSTSNLNANHAGGSKQCNPKAQVQASQRVKQGTQRIENHYINLIGDSTTQHQQIQPKTALKMQIGQGQSRKAAGNHKRSVSDGNEHLFRFKQAQMQKYLYPQPSNQTIQANQNDQQMHFVEETIPSGRRKLSSIQQAQSQGPSQQRRVSDEHHQKIKKSQQLIQQQVLGLPPSERQTGKHIGENAPPDTVENQKPQTVDFNIKGFLIEMRNKQGNNHQVDAAPSSKLKDSNYYNHAMVIEENSPVSYSNENYNIKRPSATIDVSRRMSLLDGQNVLQPGANKPTIEFNKIIQKYNQLKLEEKRASSPQLGVQDGPKNASGTSHQIQSCKKQHKRVKSDVPAMTKKHNILQIQQQLGKSQKAPSNSLQKKTSHQASGSNIFSSDKMTPRKMVPKNPLIGGINFRQPKNREGSNSKKVFNVSIDLIKDAAVEPTLVRDDTNLQLKAGQWVAAESDLLKESGRISKNINQAKGNKPYKKAPIQSLSGGTSGEAHRNDKYKKIMTNYEGNKISNKRISTGDKSHVAISQANSPVNKKSDNRKFFDKKSSQFAMPLSPKKETFTKKKDHTGITPSQSKSPHVQVPPQKQEIIQRKAFAPTNSVVQTQESARLSNRGQTICNPVSERIDTQDSTTSDPNLSPRTRAITKLTKHIKLSFRQTGQAPNTTVEFYRIGKILGKGAFGKVNLSLHKLTQKFAAVKSINKQYLSEEAQTKKVMQEVVILKRTRHRNIVRLYEFFETQKHICFVIELCAGGDLLNYVRKRRRLKEDVAKSVFKQIVEGLGYCHSKQILHRDIKLDNILLDQEGEVKICDFGVSKIVKKGETMNEQCGTPAYIAPEILRDKGYQGFAADIWSGGVVLYAMLYGTVPFKANNMSELQKMIIKAKYTLKDDISEEAQDLLRGLLEKDPLKRLTINQILNHKWLCDANEQIQLFTDQEKEIMKTEFTYNDTERFNRNETDHFTEHMLDSAQDSLFKNFNSKSVILAPFNSTKSNIQNVGSLSDSVKELMQSGRVIKFAARVRDINKQYEINNNAELDNGVYHKFVEEEDNKEADRDKNKEPDSSDDSLQTSFNKESSLKSDDDQEAKRIRQQEKERIKKKKKDQTELEKLESLIQQEEESKPTEGDHPYGTDQLFGKTHKKKNSVDLIKKTPRHEGASLLNTSALQSAQTLIIDEKLVGQIEQFGFPKDFIIKSLNNNDLNYATTSYFLLINQHTLTVGERAGFNSARAKNII